MFFVLRINFRALRTENSYWGILRSTEDEWRNMALRRRVERVLNRVSLIRGSSRGNVLPEMMGPYDRDELE
jgi:hypothetical protein